jgi:hypothetical protein
MGGGAGTSEVGPESGGVGGSTAGEVGARPDTPPPSVDASDTGNSVQATGGTAQPGDARESAGDADTSEGGVPATDGNPQFDGAIEPARDGAGAGGTSEDGGPGDHTAQSSDAGDSQEADASSFPGSLALSDLTIQANPKMGLGCYVSWTTELAASSEVQFGVGGYQLHVADPVAVTNHRVYVLGMHAQTTYQIKAVSTNGTATGWAEGTFATGALPTGFPAAGTVLTHSPDKMQRGWTLANIEAGATVGASPYPPLIVIVDESAQPVWYYLHGTDGDARGDISTTWLPTEQHVLIGASAARGPVEVDLEGNVIWTGPPQSSTPRMGHHTGKLSDGHYIILRQEGGGALVEELNRQNDIVWSWNLFDHITPPAGTSDWCHANSVTVDEAGDFLYLNCRFQGLFKANRSGSADVVWQMGAGIDSMTTGDITYLPSNDVRTNDTHEPELHDDGTILFYDNQGFAARKQGEKNGSYHSRAVEYQVDQANKQATLAWEFPGTFNVDSWYTQDWYTPAYGDADRQPNGNVLICAGNRGVGTQTRIFEVTRGGEVVWAMVWPDNHLSYRADRISPPLAQRLP